MDPGGWEFLFSLACTRMSFRFLGLLYETMIFFFKMAEVSGAEFRITLNSLINFCMGGLFGLNVVTRGRTAVLVVGLGHSRDSRGIDRTESILFCRSLVG